MRASVLAVIFGCCVGVWGQSSSGSNNPSSGATPANSPTKSAPASSPTQDSGSSSQSSSSVSPPAKPAYQPNLEPPRSDRVNASTIEDGLSSSKDTQIDLSPPAGDDKSHPNSADVLVDEGSGTTDTSQFRYWDPHKAAKDVEVGDYYFKRKNYRAAEDRYREALLYKNNDAMATFHLAECLDKMNRLREAQQEYEAYLKILPHGPESEKAQKAIERLKGPVK